MLRLYWLQNTQLPHNPRLPFLPTHLQKVLIWISKTGQHLSSPNLFGWKRTICTQASILGTQSHSVVLTYDYAVAKRLYHQRSGRSPGIKNNVLWHMAGKSPYRWFYMILLWKTIITVEWILEILEGISHGFPHGFSKTSLRLARPTIAGSSPSGARNGLGPRSAPSREAPLEETWYT